jgi:hypothetical protein
VGLLRRRNREDEELTDGEPSVLARSRGERRAGGAGPREQPQVQDTPNGAGQAEGVAASHHEVAAVKERQAKDVSAARDRSQEAEEMSQPEDMSQAEDMSQELKHLARQIQGVQQQVEELAARRGDGVADQAGQQVAAIVRAAEDSVSELKAKARQEVGAVRERQLAEADAEADRIRMEAQADAKTIRTDAHAAAAALRERTIAALRAEVDRVCARLAAELRAAAREAIETIAEGEVPSTPPDVAPRTEAGRPQPGEPVRPGEPAQPEEPMDAAADEAAEEPPSAASVLEQSLRHLDELGQGLREAE